MRSSGTGNSRAERHLAVADRGREAVDEKVVDGDAPGAGLAANDDRGAGGERDRGPIAGRIVVAQAADHGAHLPHDRIGDHPRRIMDKAPSALADPRRPLDVAVPRDRADCQHVVADAEVVQIGQRVDVDDHGRAREPEAHRRDEALPASQHAGLGPVLLQVCTAPRLSVWARKVIECCRNHVANLLPRQCRAWRATRASLR